MRERIKDMPDALELFDKACDAYDNEHMEASECYYTEGFRFGFLKALDIMGWKRQRRVEIAARGVDKFDFLRYTI